MFAAIGLTSLPAVAGPVTVDAGASIYGSSYGSAPTAISLSAGATSVQFSSVSGSITLNGGANYNDADGAHAQVSSSSITGTGGISGITAPGAGFLVGLFVPAGGPGTTAPSSLDFTTSPPGTNFTTLSPLLDQTFFVGDGLTGDGSGTTQTFFVPTGAATLYLGIADACGYNGLPGCYNDNSGTFSVTVSQQGGSATLPEPATWMTLGVGIFALALARRSIYRQA